MDKLVFHTHTCIGFCSVLFCSHRRRLLCNSAYFLYCEKCEMRPAPGASRTRIYSGDLLEIYLAILNIQLNWLIDLCASCAFISNQIYSNQYKCWKYRKNQKLHNRVCVKKEKSRNKWFVNMLASMNWIDVAAVGVPIQCLRLVAHIVCIQFCCWWQHGPQAVGSAHTHFCHFRVPHSPHFAFVHFCHGTFSAKSKWNGLWLDIEWMAKSDSRSGWCDC